MAGAEHPLVAAHAADAAAHLIGHWANFDLNAIDPNFGVPGAVVFAKNGSDSLPINVRQSYSSSGEAGWAARQLSS